MHFKWLNVNGGSVGLVANFGIEGVGSSQMKSNVFSNGYIRETTNALVLYGVDNIYENIRTIGNTTDIQFNSDVGGNMLRHVGASHHTQNVAQITTYSDASLVLKNNELQLDSGYILLANSATPSVFGGKYFLTGGTTTITNFTDGYRYQEIIIFADHTLIITDGTNIFLNGSVNWTMNASDTLTLVQRGDDKWYERARSDN